MPRKKIGERYARVNPKELWHPCGLQSLTGDRFTSVVNHILDGRYALLGFKFKATQQPASSGTETGSSFLSMQHTA